MSVELISKTEDSHMPNTIAASEVRSLSLSEVERVAGGADGSVNGSFPAFAPPGWTPRTPFIQVYGPVLGNRLYRESRSYYPPLR